MVSRSSEGKPYHDVDNEDSDITKRASTGTQVRERLVARCVDDEKTGDLVLLLAILLYNERSQAVCDTFIRYLVQDSSLRLDSFHREIGGTNLLRDTTSFTFLDIRLTNLHKKRAFEQQQHHGKRHTGVPCPEASSCRYRRVQEYSR